MSTIDKGFFNQNEKSEFEVCYLFVIDKSCSIYLIPRLLEGKF